MGEEVKKISFGFSKFTKKTQIVSSTLNQIKTENNSVELIDCFEGKAIKLKNPVQPIDKTLVIPLQRHQHTKLDFETKNSLMSSTSAASTPHDSENTAKIETISNDTVENDNDLAMKVESKPTADLKTATTKVLSLDEIAAKEIIEDLNDKKNEDESHIFTVPLTNNPPAGEKESSLEDYDNIPVGDFGLAMLRGMGWAPGKGIGKNEKLVTPSLPNLRPKGMGLGADQVLKPSLDTKTINDDLKMVKSSFIRVIAGQHKDSYGQIEGFDDETGRLIVKMALKNVSVSLNEFMVQLVDKNEFLKNSKVINVSKYEQYKDDKSKVKSEKRDRNIQRKSIFQQISDGDHDEQDQQKYQRPNLTWPTGKSTKFKNPVLESLEKITKDRECDRRTDVELPKKSNKHSSNKKRSRSRSNSSTEVKLSLKMSNKSSSIRAKSSSSSTSSTDDYRSDRKSSRSRHKYIDSDIRCSHSEKSTFKKKRRSSSTSSSSSSVSSDYDKKSVHRTVKKMLSSKRYKSKRRSRSPRERDSFQKHRNKHR